MAWNEQRAKYYIELRSNQIDAWKDAIHYTNYDDLDWDGLGFSETSKLALLDVLESMDTESIAEVIMDFVSRKKKRL